MVGTGAKGTYPTYTCTTAEHVGKHSVSISADHVETLISEATEDALGLREGRSSGDLGAAEAEVEKIEARLDRARRLSIETDDAAGYAEIIRELKAERDEARRVADDLRTVASVTILGGLDFAEFPRETRRDLIETMIEAATVAPAEARRTACDDGDRHRGRRAGRGSGSA